MRRAWAFTLGPSSNLPVHNGEIPVKSAEVRSLEAGSQERSTESVLRAVCMRLGCTAATAVFPREESRAVWGRSGVAVGATPPGRCVGPASSRPGLEVQAIASVDDAASSHEFAQMRRIET